MSELQILRDKMAAARKAYYNDQPIMTDAEYDALEEELARINSTDPLLKEIGSEVTGGIWPKRQHESPMGSLNKVKGPEGLREWWAKTAQIAGG